MMVPGHHRAAAGGSALGSVLTIVIVGVIAALSAYGAVSFLGVGGVGGAIVAVLVAMAVALPLFAIVVRLFRRSGR